MSSSVSSLVLVVSIVVWGITFAVGNGVDSKEIAKSLGEAGNYQSVDIAFRSFLSFVSSIWPNLLVLCVTAAIIGGVVPRPNGGSPISTASAISTGFIVFVTFASAQFGVNGSINGIVPREVENDKTISKRLDDNEGELRREVRQHRYQRLAFLGSLAAVSATGVRPMGGGRADEGDE